jgi:hypothetical protein
MSTATAATIIDRFSLTLLVVSFARLFCGCSSQDDKPTITSPVERADESPVTAQPPEIEGDDLPATAMPPDDMLAAELLVEWKKQWLDADAKFVGTDHSLARAELERISKAYKDTPAGKEAADLMALLSREESTANPDEHSAE